MATLEELTKLKKGEPTMAHRKDVSTLSNAQRAQLRTLLDQFINKPTNNPVAEHMAAGMDVTS